MLMQLAAEQTVTDYKNNFTSDSRQRRAVAYKRHESIKIVPGGDHIHKRSIPEGLAELNFNRTETEEQVKCCPRRVCVCLSTTCNLNCQPPSVLVDDTANSTPGKCCESFKCVQPDHCEHNNRIYANGTQWKEQDSCIECECVNGKATCSTSLCKPLSCLKKKQVPGECCPVCDYANTNFCVGDEWCDKVCKHGYRRSEAGCSLCKCAREQPHHYPEVNNTETPIPSTTTATTTSTLASATTTTTTSTQAPATPTNPIISCPDNQENQLYIFVVIVSAAVIVIGFFIFAAFCYFTRSSRQRYRVVNSADSLYNK
jgi:von Willebrand factor type C domain